MQDDPLHHDRAETTALLWRVNRVAILLPLGTIGLLYLFSILNDTPYSKKDWKTLLLVIWGITLLLTARVALRGIRFRRRRMPAADDQLLADLADDEPAQLRRGVHRVNRWEDRRSRKLTTEFAIAGFLVPAAASFIAYRVLLALGTTLSIEQISHMCCGAALLAILLLMLRASRARRSRPMYSVEDLAGND